eukprot:1795581-Rhodomonas_salina.1
MADLRQVGRWAGGRSGWSTRIPQAMFFRLGCSRHSFPSSSTIDWHPLMNAVSVQARNRWVHSAA